MKNKSERGRMLAKGLLATAAALSVASGAQAQEAGTESEIVVTGSRIRAPNLESTSPIQAVGREEIQLQGTYDTVNVINTLPQNFQQAGADFSNTSNPLSGPGGITTANLRGLGPQRTLVLIDGVRLGMGDANSGNPNPGANLDNIPGQMIERVDVVTGGASAVYGADAVAGVVNFIMRDDFEGVQFDGRVGFAQHSNDDGTQRQRLIDAGLPLADDDRVDGWTNDFSVMFGANSPDGKGNVTAYISYHQQEPVTQATRDFGGCLLANFGEPDLFCANSSNSNILIDTRLTSPTVGTAYAVFGTDFILHPNDTGIDPGINPPPTFNSSPFQFLQRDDTRYSAGFNGHYDLSDRAQFYAQVNYTNDRSTSQVGPSAVFQQNGVFNINCDNPFLSVQQFNAICTGVVDTDAGLAGNQGNAEVIIGRRNVEGGPRVNFFEHNTFRAITGIRGDLDETWHYDVYGQFYYSSSSQIYSNDVNKAAVRNALQVRDVGNGPQCLVAIAGIDTSCRPYNIFQDGGVDAAALGYFNVTALANGNTEQHIVNATLTGDLGTHGIRLPGAEDGVGVAVGVEYRSERAEYVPDAVQQSGNLTGTGGALPESRGHYDVAEIFGEIRVPIVQRQPFFYDLSVDAGYRFSDYSSIGTTDTYKAGLQWAPSEDVRFRASYQRAVRAPNITELYVPAYVTNSQDLTGDPCSGTSPTATLAECVNTGLDPLLYGTGAVPDCPAGQCGVQQGGNPLLDAETSDTFSVGMLFTPTFIQGLTISIDWWKIEQEDQISSVSESTIFEQCLTTGVNCDRVVRTPQGFLFGDTIEGGGWVKTLTDNLASQVNSGVDLQVNYALPVPDSVGGMTVSFYGTYTDQIEIEDEAGAPKYDCSGLFGPSCGLVAPEWRHNARFSWDTPFDWLFSVSWRYIGDATYEGNTDEPRIGAGVGSTPAIKLDEVNYFDLAAVWNLSPSTVLRASVNNVTDEDPPIVPALDTGLTGLPNAYPTYDFLGRVFSIGFTKDF